MKTLGQFSAKLNTEATRSAREMMADELRRGPLTPGRSFDIVGDQGAVLATIVFHDCLYAKA